MKAGWVPVSSCAFLLFAASAAAQVPAPAPTPEAATSPKQFKTKVVAFVNRDVITEAEVWRELRGAATGASADRREQMFREKLLGIILDRVYAQASERIQLVINPETITALIEDRKEAAGGTEAFAQSLREQGTTIGEYEANLSRSYQKSVIERIRAGELKGLGEVLRAEHVIDPTNAEVRRFYEVNRDRQFRIGASAHIQKMFFSMNDYKAVQNETEQVALRIKGEIETGADWKILAERHSSDAGDKEKGGDLGWVQLEESELAPEILAYAGKGEVGKVSDPIPSARGHFLLRVVDRKEPRIVPFTECQKLIREFLREGKVKRARAEVELRLLKEAYIQPADLKQILLIRAQREALGVQ